MLPFKNRTVINVLKITASTLQPAIKLDLQAAIFLKKKTGRT